MKGVKTMAVSRKVERDLLRQKWVDTLFNLLKEMGEDVHLTKSNEFGFPAVGCEMNEETVLIVVKIPTGGKDEDGYDLYGEAESYEMKLKEKAKKAAEKEKKKEKEDAK